MKAVYSYVLHNTSQSNVSQSSDYEIMILQREELRETIQVVLEVSIVYETTHPLNVLGSLFDCGMSASFTGGISFNSSFFSFFFCNNKSIKVKERSKLFCDLITAHHNRTFSSNRTSN